MEPRTIDRLMARVWLAQAVYDVVTGIWGMAHIPSFERVTGPKVDRWLVKCVSALMVVIGAAIGRAGARQAVTPEIAIVAVGSAASLAGIDLVYVAKGRISRVYLLDAAANLLLIAGWFVALRRNLIRLS